MTANTDSLLNKANRKAPLICGTPAVITHLGYTCSLGRADIDEDVTVLTEFALVADVTALTEGAAVRRLATMVTAVAVVAAVATGVFLSLNAVVPKYTILKLS